MRFQLKYVRLLLILACLLVPHVLLAQTDKIDSLIKFLDGHPEEDTLRVNTLNALCKAYLIELNDKKKMDVYAKEILALSKKINYKRGIGFAYLNMGTVSLGKSNYGKALDFYFAALEIFQHVGDNRGISSCYQNIGNVKSNQGMYADALGYSLKAAKLKSDMGDKQGAAGAFNNIGMIYANLGDLKKALEYHFRALRIREAIHDKLGVSGSYLNIGNIFSDQNKFNESMTYERKALAIKMEIGDKEGEAIIYNNIANIYTTQKNFKESLVYHLKSLKIREETKDIQGIGMSYNNIGISYLAQNKINEALSYYKKASVLCEQVGDKLNVVVSSNGIGSCYEQQGKYTQALDHYLKALSISQEINFKVGVKETYSNLSSVYEKLNNYEKALSYNKLFTDLKDTLLNEESLKETSELNTRYETDKKEKEILLLTKDQQLKDKTLKEQRFVRIGLSIGLGLLLALSFLLFNRYRFKQKANLILEKQKEEIHQKNILITDSIDYAKTIQEAILPDDEKLNSYFPDHFILYKPKAIVSGDFYWIGKKDNKIICAVADCTGHGVPGAFMSLLGHNILENVIQRDAAVDPGAILSALNEEIVTRFSKGKERETVKHGMDIAIISIDTSNQQLQYAGARNSLYLVSKNGLTELKADKMSTGIVSKDHVNVQYTNNSHTFQKGDMIYLFSDGFPDQKGGPDQKKFYYQPFKALLLSINNLPVEKQKQQLNETIINWIGEGEQIDDILVMGIRCS